MTSAVSPVGDQRPQIGLEDVCFDDPHLRLVAKTEGQLGGEGAVELQRNQPFGSARRGSR